MHDLIENIRFTLKEIEQFLLGCDFTYKKFWKKEDMTFLSDLDIEIQQKLVQIILKKFPNHSFFFEEGEVNFIDNKSEFCWVIDPIDGTENFISGKNEFSTTVGLLYKGNFIGSITVFPKLNESYLGLKDVGVFKNGVLIEGYINALDSNKILLCSKSFNNKRKHFEEMGYLVECYHCATYSILQVIQNKAVFYFTQNTQIYDVGPMSHIVKVYGGHVLDKYSNDLKYNVSLKERIPFFFTTLDSRMIKLIKYLRDD